jgi:hypothetical protein
MAEPGTITAPPLARLSGLTERHLRDLAAEGVFPTPVNGFFQLVPTIQGLLLLERFASSAQSGGGVTRGKSATNLIAEVPELCPSTRNYALLHQLQYCG